nr:uncharacterized protein LOC122269121 [Parasteatoda tepidariorum]
MHSINRSYRKPKARPSKKKLLAQQRNQARWKKDVSKDENILPQEDTPLSSTTELNTSVSARKLQFPVRTLNNSQVTSKEVQKTPNYVLMNKNMWSTLLKNINCTQCDEAAVDVAFKEQYGYSSKLELYCRNCETMLGSTFSSPRCEDSKSFLANIELVEAFLKIGKGHASLEQFSIALGIQTMDKKTFSKCLQTLCEEKKTFREDMLCVARQIVRKTHFEINCLSDDEKLLDITVSFDGSWHKRGHTSLYGLGVVIDVLTGLAVDFEISSKYCSQCTAAKRDLGNDSAEFSIWYNGHKSECSKNFSGSSGSMEMVLAGILWSRSVKNCGFRYLNIVSDGDSRTYQHLVELKPYGEDVQIVKEECLNHVSKRLGTGLRNKVKELRSKGVTIGGRKKGSLKESTIIKLTNFYRKAIKDNCPDITKMKSAIYASLLHCSSSDKAPKHSKCPTGVQSWCFFQRALATSEIQPSHEAMKTYISEDVLSKILPIYQRLASDELLKRCTSGGTQNANESIHSLIWNKCSKETFVSKERLEFAVISSVSEFNFGCVNTLYLEKDETDYFSLNIAEKRDKRRLSQSAQRNTKLYKRHRLTKKYGTVNEEKKNVKKEGSTYAPGKF